MRLTWPLVGRTEELRSIETALCTPGVSGIVIAGAPGVGKSRIVREALSAAESRGQATRLAVGTSSARGIPLGAFTAWASPGVSDTVQLLGGVITSLTAATTGADVVLAVDDAHLLDDLSTFVVHQIAQRHAAKLILTVLDGEPTPAAVQEIWKVGQFDRLQVSPLPLEHTTALLAATLAGPVDTQSARRLWDLTRGNTLYLRNIVEQEIADGTVENQDGHWRWIGEPTVGPGLVELIESRIGALPTAVADVVDALAVGEPLELAILQRIADRAAVEEADTRGLITVEPTAGGIEVRVAHPIYGEVRRRHAPATKLRRLRGVIATELAACNDSDDFQLLVRRAALSVDSDLAPDADLLTRAARGAVWLADLGLADRLAAAAISAGAGPEPDFIRAHALSWSGRGAAADSVLAGIDPKRLTEEERARLAFLRASNALWALGDPERAKRILDEAAHSTPSPGRSYIDAFRTVYWFAMDQPRAAALAAAELEGEQLPPVVGAEMAWALSTIDADAGRTSAAVHAAEAGYDAVERSFDAPHMRFNIADSHVSALVMAGRTAEASRVADRVQLQAADLPGAAQLLGAAVAGRAALGAGDIRSACSRLEHAADGLLATHALGWGFRYQIPRATALAMSGETEQAAAILSALTSMRRPFRALDYEHSVARAWVAAGRGGTSAAVTLLRAAADRAAAAGRFAAEVICLQTATQFGDRDCGPRLRELTGIVEGPRADLAARFAEALHNRDGAELATVSAAFAGIGDLVAAVDASAHAALVYRSQDLRGSALNCMADADALAEQCGAATPVLRLVREPLPLTDREREIAMLIAAGLLNREIAERLTLSPRTVESHIYRAMARTGTANREELAALVTRRHRA